MNEQVLVLLRELLCKTATVNTAQELENISVEYADKLGVGGNALMEAVWTEIKNIGADLVLLRSREGADGRGKQLSALTEQEQAELAEAQRVIDENLFGYHFQPIVRVSDGEIYSYEALMRPQSTLCPSPYHIMKYAELTDRLDDIERATFLNILGIIDSGKDGFGGRRVFINSIPRTKLTETDYAQVCALLEKHSETVVVEMTEQAELGDEEFDRIKEQYERMNIKIAVDDYGTGYSNVQNLLRYMPNYVKIDRSLLSEIQNSSKKRHFVREIIEFCHDNDVLALAEGVETADELRTVIHLGVDLIQGYYTARPNAVIADSIPPEIRQEIKHYRQEREEGKQLHIYIADKTERILLDRLSKENYSCILVGKNGDGDITVSGMPGMDTRIHIEIVNGYKGTVILENVVLWNKNGRPCIDVGENCEMRLAVLGMNHLKKGGIRVPESAKLIIGGEGKLNITIDGASSYGIGNDLNSRHGELIFEQGVWIDHHACQTGVCIGSGLGGTIRILHGQFGLNFAGAQTGVGIGSLYADTDLDIFACNISMEVSLVEGAAIGSVSGSCRAYIHSAAVKLYLSGKNVVGIGTISGETCETEISEANAVFNLLADHCSAVASLKGDTTFKLSRAGMHITAEGANALAFGGFAGDTNVFLTDADSAVRLVHLAEHADFVRSQNIAISGGRARFVVNDEELFYTAE